MDKELFLIDGAKSNDNCTVHKTDIRIYTEGTNELLFRGSNKVILAGSIFTAVKHWNITPLIKTPSYNSILALENTIVEDPGFAGYRREEEVILFAVGTDGCGLQNDQVYEVNYKKWTAPEALVPFRYPLLNNDIDDAGREIYFGRKENNGYVAYYFKRFETTPLLIQQYVDGTPIDDNVYNSSKNDEIENIVEVKLKITKDDCREIFIQGAGLNSSRINTISLLTAWPRTINGKTYYQDIRPLTKINIPNEALINVTKGLDIIYHIYY